MLHAVLAAWEQLAAAAWQGVALICGLLWLGVLARTIQASPKSYANEQRITNLENPTLILDATTPINFALAHGGGTDPRNSDGYATGFTGQVHNWQPSSNPRIISDWRDLPSGVNGWGLGANGYKKFRNLADGSVQISIYLQLIGTKTDGTQIFPPGALPSGYQPGFEKKMPAIVNSNALSTNWPPMLQFRADGSIYVYGVNDAGLVELSCHCILPIF